MKVHISDSKGGFYELYTHNGKTFIQAQGRYRFIGEVIQQDEKICEGGKLKIRYQKNGSVYPNIFESGTITEISVEC